ncbi:MAG: sulfite exporter TauE/SafE family protein [Xanthomonadaceae bacterium]|nr:sulfite exporter TauE/SafE family protein [Xanthomonadaceae bacterium]
MEWGLATLGLAALAGLLTMLNPCVLPLLPVVASAAMARSAAGLLALAGGMSVTFAVAGTALAATGQVVGLEGDTLRLTAAVLMVLVGLLLVSAPLQRAFARATAGIADFGHAALARFQPEGAGGQFAAGALLGLVWTPCIGPTLGAAIALAAQGEALPQVAAVMVVFSLFAVLPLAAIGFASRVGFQRHRATAAGFGRTGRTLMGYGLLAIGLLVLTGGDKVLETLVLDHAPDWLIDLTTRY